MHVSINLLNNREKKFKNKNLNKKITSNSKTLGQF